MRIFITGGTGVIGRRVVQKLSELDHNLIVLSRSKEKSKWLSNLGAEPVEGSLYDQNCMNSYTKNVDGVVNLATSIPKKMKTKPKDWIETCRLRTEGKKILIQSSLENKCKFFIQESFLMVYGHQNGNWVDESTPIEKPVSYGYKLPEKFQFILNNAVEAEEIINKAHFEKNLPSIILRYGVFYSEDASSTIDMLKMIEKHRFPIVGNGDSFTNPIHLEDAATATVNAIENYRTAIGNTFNICDDEPVKLSEFLNFVAKQTNSDSPRKFPLMLAKFLVDPYILNVIYSSVRCKNTLAKEKLNWSLKYPTFREGISEVVRLSTKLTA